MPLARGSSQKTVSSNISELVYSFSKPVFNVLHVFKRVAIWAKHLKIVHIIIFWVSILMMNAQNFLLCIVPTSFAFINQPSSKHVFSNGLKTWKPNVFFWFINTIFAAINSRFRRAGKEIFTTMLASAGNRPLKSLRFIVTFFATIFCFVRSGRYVRKHTGTNFAICGNSNSRCQRFAGSRAILKTIKSIPWYVHKSFAVPTSHLLPCVEF